MLTHSHCKLIVLIYIYTFLFSQKICSKINIYHQMSTHLAKICRVVHVLPFQPKCKLLFTWTENFLFSLCLNSETIFFTSVQMQSPRSTKEYFLVRLLWSKDVCAMYACKWFWYVYVQLIWDHTSHASHIYSLLTNWKSFYMCECIHYTAMAFKQKWISSYTEIRRLCLQRSSIINQIILF